LKKEGQRTVGGRHCGEWRIELQSSRERKLLEAKARMMERISEERNEVFILEAPEHVA
jgi:hypothetical protein